jgi:hypothetical protein
MTLEEAVLKALEQGPGNLREITERLEWRVRNTLSLLAEADRINRAGWPGRGNEKSYSLKPPPKVTIERRI